MFDQSATRFLHQVATPKTDFRLRIFFIKRFHQIGSVQIARSFSSNNVVFHLLSIV